MLKRFGPHPVGKSCDSYGRSPQDFCTFRDRLIEGVKKKTELTLHYMNKVNGTFLPRYSPKAIAPAINAGIFTTRVILIMIRILFPYGGSDPRGVQGHR